MRIHRTNRLNHRVGAAFPRPSVVATTLVLVGVGWLSSEPSAVAQNTVDPFSDPSAVGTPGTVAPPPVDAPVASAAASARRVLLGRSFVLVVRVVHAQGIEVNLPSALKMGGVVDELRRTSEKQTNPDGSETREFELEVMAFALGEITIPPIEVTYTGRGSVGRVRTNPIALEIVGVIGDGEGALQDIRPPVEVRRKDYTLLYVAAALVGTFLGFWLLLRLRRFVVRGRARAAVRIANRAMAPDEQALTRLHAIVERGDLEADDLKPAYLEMSEILKAYIGRRFGFPANELTTLEIRNELAARPHGELAESKIRGWLKEADLVKFANQKASSEDGRASLEAAEEFVRAFAPSSLPTPSLGVVSITDMGGDQPAKLEHAAGIPAGADATTPAGPEAETMAAAANTEVAEGEEPKAERVVTPTAAPTSDVVTTANALEEATVDLETDGSESEQGS